MSSKTLAVSAHAGRICGAVIESSIGSLKITGVFDLDGDAGIPAGGPFDRVVATLDSGAAAFRVLALPFRDRRRVSQAVGPALEEHVPFSLDDGILAWDIAGSPAGKTADGPGATVLAAIAETSRIDQAKKRIAALGAEAVPQRLLWEPSVILTAYRHAVGEGASFLAVDIGDGGALAARFENGQLLALRVVSPCDEELLVRNTAWAIATIAGDQSRAVIGGRHGVRLGDVIARRVAGLRVEALPATSPIDGLAGRDWREFTSLVGLVLAASGDSLPPLLDFEATAGSLLGVAALRELQTEAAPLLRWGAAAAVLAILAVGIDYVQLFAERGTLAERAEKIYATAMPTGSGGAGRKLKMQMRLSELTGKAESASSGAAGSPLALLAALSRDVPKSLGVIVDQVEHVPPAAKVTGHATSFETVTRMQEALQKGGSFSRVEVKDVHASVTGGGVEFLLELSTAKSEAGA